MKKEIIESLFGNSETTYYRWKKEKRPIIDLIEKYFYDYELEEFLENKKISRIENVNKFLPQINGIKAIEEILKINEIEEYENEIKGQYGVLADYIHYMYKYENEYEEDYEILKYYYIKEDTFAQTIDKIELLKNNINLNLIIYFCCEIDHDFIDTIHSLKDYNKRIIYDIIVELIAPLIDMVHNNSIGFYYDTFDKILCEKHNIEFVKFYEQENSFQKKIILECIDEFIFKIKKEKKENNEQN